MDRERWQRIDRLFLAAFELEPEERAAFLSRECAGDEALLGEVESLLAHHRDDGFLEDHAATEAARLVVERGVERLVGGRVGRFEIEARLGAGGMGVVYRARDPRLGRAVALKLIPSHLRDDPERRRRFRREAMAASALNHPNIVTVHEIAEHDDSDLLITELIEGVSLRERLNQGPLPVEDALDIARQIARGLAAAHAAGVVHRDVKPENVMIRPDGLVKILDFGIAKDLRGAIEARDPAAGTETRDGAVFGTAAYMSPEQARGEPVDARTDVWSLGVVLYEMLTSSKPFDARTPSDRVAAILLAQPEPPSRRRASLPAGVDELVVGALAKDREDRYPDAGAFGRELELSREAVRSRSSGSWAAARRLYLAAARSRRLLAACSLAALVAASGALALWRVAGRAPAIDSIAVLPLENAEQEPQLEYLGDGITESLIQGLAEAEGLRVVSRAAAFRYKGRQPPTAREIGRELGVRSVLSGRLSTRDDRLALSVELIDTRDDSHLWGRRYELLMTELNTLHERIADDVLVELRHGLTGEQRARVGRLHSGDVEAYRLYLEGRFYWNQLGTREYERSRELFLRAIDLDPEYALAWAGLGHYYGYAAAGGVADPSDYWPRAELAARRVRELDPALPELGSLEASLAFYWHRDWGEADRLMRRAVQVFPEAALHYSKMLQCFGRHQEALELLRTAVDQDPLSVRIQRTAGLLEYLAHNYESAVTYYRRSLELDSGDVFAWEGVGDASAALGREEDAVRAFRQGLLLAGRAELATRLEEAYGTAGLDAALAVVASARLGELRGRRERGEYVPAYRLARLALRAGRRAEALEWVARTFQERNRLVLDMVEDPVFAAVHDEPSFQQGVRDLGLPGPGH